MSFKEIKSLLRMVNVDMNDMYAYRLFKVGPLPYPALSSLGSLGQSTQNFPSPQAVLREGWHLPACWRQQSHVPGRAVSTHGTVCGLHVGAQATVDLCTQVQALFHT